MSKVVLASQLPNKRNASLAPGLKQRHVTMLSIAGVIGAGLFVGSGHAIAAAGPAALLAYLIAGTLVVRESEINQKGKARKLWDIEEGKGI